MIQNPQRPVSSIAFPILVALSISHCLNDLLQSVITAVYPLFKDDLGLSFAQIGLITLVYQMSASVFQPIFGLFFDKRPVAWTLPAGMLFTMTGMLNLAFASTGSLTYHFIGFGWQTGTCPVFVSSGRKSGRLIRTFVGCFVSCSLRT